MNAGRLALAVTVAALPGLAWAHAETGSQFSLFSGLAHPFMGADHLLAMLMVGVWAAQQEGWKCVLPPLAFVGFMAVGSLLAHWGVALPVVEFGIALSVLALGLLAAFAVRPPAAVVLATIAIFAIFHGHAHGAELPLTAAWGYMPGFLAATSLLHGIGYIFASRLVDSRGQLARAASGAIACTGLVWLLT